MSISHIVKNITEVIPEFKKLSLQDRSWLVNLYDTNYNMGQKAIGKDVFLNENYVTTQSLKERLKSYPETSVHDTEFMQKLAANDDTALDAILNATGDEENFIYETYEENYTAWVPKSVEKTLEVIPSTLQKYDLDLLAKEAFSQGILYILEKYAKESINLWAKNTLKKED